MFSATAGDWVPVKDLGVGEDLQTSRGRQSVAALGYQHGRHQVYNIEVETEHCYFVGTGGVLTHNGCLSETQKNLTQQGDALAAELASRKQAALSEKPNGNTLDGRPATLYEKYDKDGNFQKHGMTQHEDPSKRYTAKEIGGGEVRPVVRGPRSEIAKKERSNVETSPGPANKEPWAGKRAGKKK